MLPGSQKNYQTLSEPLENPNGSMEDNGVEVPRQIRRFRLSWVPSSKEEYLASEKKLLSCLKFPYELENVDAGEVLQPGGCCGCKAPKLIKVQLPTLFVNRSRPGIPLVLFHGLGLGFGFFVTLIKGVKYSGPVIAVDLPGFGRSTKFKFPKNAKDAEATHIQVLESWRSTLGLEKFVIGGLSLGGYLGTSYALTYPERVAHLVLIDAWGFPEKPETVTSLVDEKNPIIIRLMALASKHMSIFTPFRLLGPWGFYAYNNVGNSEGFDKKFDKQVGVDGIANDLNEYCYHCMAVHPPGEDAFRYMSKWIVYAREPLCRRIHELKVPTTMIVAEKSWVPWIPKDELERLVGPACRMDFIMIPSTTHENITLSKGLEELLQNLAMKEKWADV